MRPVRTERSNFTYVGPTSEIADLPCERDGDGAVFSVYELTDTERAMIANGAQIRLGIHSEPIPPVSLDVTNEPLAQDEDDLRCERCRAMYRREVLKIRGQHACGQCGGRLVDPTETSPANPVDVAEAREAVKPGGRVFDGDQQA